MNKKKLIYIGLSLLAFVFICLPLLPYIVDFGTGSDNAATDMIMQINPDVKPWFDFTAPFDMDKYEPLLFAFQVFIGLAVFAYCMHLLNKRKVKE